MSKFIVWTENRAGYIDAKIKPSRLAAKRAYNKLYSDPTLKECGWSESESADPPVRVAAGLKPFLELGERDS